MNYRVKNGWVFYTGLGYFVEVSTGKEKYLPDNFSYNKETDSLVCKDGNSETLPNCVELI